MTRAEIAEARRVLAAYYADSVSGSVLSSTPVIVEAPAPQQPPLALTDARRALLAERETLRATIDAAYWRFTRQARALPPSMQCPDAYARLQEVNDLLSA